MLLTGLAYRALIAFTNETILNWDETYYASIASTGARGLGLYPYVQGYGQIPFQGGVGIAAYAYVFAYKIFGPNFLGLRLVSITASVIGLGAVFVLTRKWYGTITAFIAIAILPYLYLFQETNSIRMDTIVFAYLSWALVFFAFAWDRKEHFSWQIATGVVFATGLHVHIHTTSVTFAVGLLYLIDAIINVYRTRQYRDILKSPVAGYFVGYAIGLALFFIITILPNPETFFRTAGAARLMEQGSGYSPTYTWDISKLLGTFFSPYLLFAKEQIRYEKLMEELLFYEWILWGSALFALFVTRRHKNDSKLRILFIGTIIGNAIILNNSSPIYLSHSLPLLILPLAPFLRFGFNRSHTDHQQQVPFFTLIIMLMLFFAVLNTVPVITEIQKYRAGPVKRPAPELVQSVKTIASPECKIAGDSVLYLPYFLEYTYYIGTREPEFIIGSIFYDLYDQPVEYWKQKHPDLIFGELEFGLDEYVKEMNYIEISSDLWVKSENLSKGCRLVYP